MPLLAAVIAFNVFLRVSIKRVLLEYKIPLFSIQLKAENSWLLLPSVMNWQDKGSSPIVPVCKGDPTCSSSPFCSQYLHILFSKYSVQLHYFNHLTALSSPVQSSTLKGLWLHPAIALIPPLLMTDGHHGEETSVLHTYRFIWAKLLQKACDTFPVEALMCSCAMIWTVTVFSRWPSTRRSFSSSSSECPRYELRLSLPLRR